jgi:hypothetical protein
MADDRSGVKREEDKSVYTIGATDESNNALAVQSDREKNTYSIGASKGRKAEELRKEERSWDVLTNTGIVVEGQHKSVQGRATQGRTVRKPAMGSQPANGQPVPDQPHQNQSRQDQRPQPASEE